VDPNTYPNGQVAQVGDVVAPLPEANEPHYTGRLGKVVGVGLGSPADPFLAVKYKGERQPKAFYARHLMLQSRLNIPKPSDDKPRATETQLRLAELAARMEVLEAQVGSVRTLAAVQDEHTADLVVLGHKFGLLLGNMEQAVSLSKQAAGHALNAIKELRVRVEALENASRTQNKAPLSDETPHEVCDDPIHEHGPQEAAIHARNSWDDELP
jgi:hypothetical protein